jgi:hypothetical protein
MMADNRLDALLYATYDHAPTKLPHTTLGTNRQLAPVLGFPALAVPGGFSSDGLPLGFDFSACHSPKELCSKRRMTLNSPQKFAGPRPLYRHCQNENLVGHICRRPDAYVMKAAKALRLTVLLTLQVAADQVIE